MNHDTLTKVSVSAILFTVYLNFPFFDLSPYIKILRVDFRVHLLLKMFLCVKRKRGAFGELLTKILEFWV